MSVDILKFTFLACLLVLVNSVEVQAATPACGTTLKKNTKLDADMNCPGPALRLDGNGSKKVKLDCDGYRITTTQGRGIIVSNVKDVVIQNCVINTSATSAHGIVFNGRNSTPRFQ